MEDKKKKGLLDFLKNPNREKAEKAGYKQYDSAENRKKQKAQRKEKFSGIKNMFKK